MITEHGRTVIRVVGALSLLWEIGSNPIPMNTHSANFKLIVRGDMLIDILKIK